MWRYAALYALGCHSRPLSVIWQIANLYQSAHHRCMYQIIRGGAHTIQLNVVDKFRVGEPVTGGSLDEYDTQKKYPARRRQCIRVSEFQSTDPNPQCRSDQDNNR